MLYFKYGRSSSCNHQKDHYIKHFKEVRMLFKKIIILCILTLSFSLFTTNIYANADEVKNEFVSVFYTAAGERCYRDMATDGDFAGLNAASDASFEAAWGKSLVKGDENNPPSELYIKRVGLQPTEKIDGFGLLISGRSEIVHCDVIYPPAPAIFKSRSNQAEIPRELQKLIFETNAWITFTVGDNVYDRKWNIVRVTAISDDIIKIELFYSSDPANPFAIYELPRAYHQAWRFHHIADTVIHFTNEAGNDYSVVPEGILVPGGILVNVDTCALSAVAGYCNF